MSHRRGSDHIWIRSPYGAWRPRLAVAAARAGALPLVDVAGPDDLAALAEVLDRSPSAAGVALGPAATAADALADVVAVVVGAVHQLGPHARPGRRLIAEVTSLDEACVALEALDGALPLAGLLAKGAESGGRVGETGAFVLLQQVVGELRRRGVELPVWVQGGIGLHTAPAAIVGGAAGVVLGDQLALTKEARPAPDLAQAIRAMDGSETVVLGGHRVFTRPDLPAVALADRVPPVDATEVVARLGPSLRHSLVPLGQDASLAAGLATTHRTVGGVVQAVLRSIDAAPAAAADQAPLAPGSRLATSLGIACPVAQGPMTRVSDRAAFAAQVADAGGLPFLALALLRGDEIRELLAETQALLGDRPWGVGILGFVPPELREEQLAVVHEVAPPVALIAGGRPAQAAPLDAAGIVTFLHVPSPGLLDRFLRDGARRFVFEGRECGGHVGPRSSFTLWEQQVDRLLAFASAGGTDGRGSLSGVEAFFAGGVHDECSAAMVSTIAAPLAARGAGIGVLMGTAYLFTEEAVSDGAIQPAFQDAALSCVRTVLLETSPGHATRCVDSAYVQAFLAEKERLVEAGATVQEMWAELEQLNLGRLRIAAKGLTREGDQIVSVDEPTQRREGMYMIGDVATLRDERTTVASLHRQVTAGATAYLADHLTRHRPAPTAAAEVAPLDVAIIGMACVFPGAGDADVFWSNVVHGVDSVTEVPAERWSAAQYYDEHAFTENAGVKTPSRWGGFVPEVPFDALAYGIPPRSLASIEPVQLLALEVAQRALADAGYAEREFDRERASVIFGAEAGTDLSAAYGFRSLLPTFTGHEVAGALDDYLPRLTEDSFPGLLTNVIAGRIANRLDLGGVNYTVDAACAASLAALDLACKELREETSDLVLCGGADLHNGINDYLLFASVHALSPTGRCQTFDAAADGIALGEGVACVVLKRLADAERDGDRVYAVIKGIGGSSDGRHLGLTAPRKEGQRRALDRAYARAGIDPAHVGLVEAHGTGTVVGDRTELATLTEMFAESGAGVGAATVGSVKSNIGHTKCAAGLAGLIKAANAVYRGIRPPTLHVRTPNPGYDAATSPFRIDASAAPWVETVRVAGVSAFGFGGTNFHAVLARYTGDDGPEHGLEEWPAELLLFRGTDHAAVQGRIEDLLDWLDRAHRDGAPVLLRDVAAAVCAVGSGPVQVAVVAESVADLRAKLAVASTFAPERGGVFVAPAEAAPATDRGELAFLFPGQGSQRPGMLGDLFVAFPWLHQHLEVGREWLPQLFPPAAFTREDADAQHAAITDTRVAQPTLGIAGASMAHVLRQLGVTPDSTAGHSYGELVALTVAGAFGEADLLTLSRLRGELILEAAGDDPGSMAAVLAAPSEVDEVLARADGVAGVVVANRNSPSQSVISGPTADLARAIDALKAAGLTAKRIPVACAFHSPVVAAAAPALGAHLASVEVGALTCTVWSNTLAAPYDGAPSAIRQTLARQVGEPVRWVEQIEAMYASGVRVFVECGPGRVLTQLVGKILGARPHVAVATDVAGEPGLRRLLQAVAELAVAGVDVDPTVLFDGRATPVDLRAAPPAAPGWRVNGHLVRTRDGEIVPGGLRPFDEVPAGLGLGGAPGGTRSPERDGAVVEYLRGMREMVAVQREVMLQYLGGAIPERGAGLPVLDVASMEAASPVAMPVGPATGLREAGPGGAASRDGASPTAPDRELSADELRAAVLQIVCDRTGYPIDMLDPELDLEADLSIDSIKRIEILGELADRVGLPGAEGDTIDESVVEELAQIKTINGIVAWILERGGGGPERPAGDDAPEGSAEEVPDPHGPAVPDHTLRFTVSLADALPAEPHPVTVLAGRHFVVVDDERGVALGLATRLEEHAATVRLVRGDGPLHIVDGESIDGFVDLSAIAGGRATAREAFAGLRSAALAGTSWLVAVTGAGGRFGLGDPAGGERPEASGFPPGAGLAGLLQSVARELPDCHVRAIDVDVKDDPASLAAAVFDELLLPGQVAVGRVDGRRTALVVTEAPLGRSGDSRLPGEDGVALLTGGARGITARVAIALAHETGCQVVLVGRTPLPEGEEDEATAGAADAPAVRRALIEQGARTPAEIEATVARMLAEREMRATMAAIAAAGRPAMYVTADVRDAVALRTALESVHDAFGRIDLVVHGAGVLEDKFLRDKTPESFARVFDTKVSGAGTIVGTVAPTATVVLFGSVAGVFGNRGQVDYAAGNDALDGLARAARGAAGPVVLAADWGPWAGGGMVSAELEREYARRGIGLVGADEGVTLLLDELRAGAPAPQVVFMRARPEAMMPAPGR